MGDEDYALLAAKEFFTIERSRLVDDGDSDGLYELDRKEGRLAAIIRRYAGEEMAKREYELERGYDESRLVQEAGEEW